MLPSAVPSVPRAVNSRQVLPAGQSFTTRKPSSLTRRCCVRVSPIAQNSSLLPPVGVDRVSVPVWLIILSDQLTIEALVGRYPANKLMVRGLISEQKLACRGYL